MNRRYTQFARGFTLMEALLASVVLAAAISAMTVPFVAGARNEQDDARRTLAVALAQEMMEEILAQPFHDEDSKYYYAVGPDPTERGKGLGRSRFDNMDDYDGYDEVAGEIANMDGQAIAESAATDLSRHVTADYVYVSGQDTEQSPTFLRVTVEVRYQGTTIVRLARLAYDTSQ